MWLFLPIGGVWLLGANALAMIGLHPERMSELAAQHGGSATILTVAVEGGPVAIATLSAIVILVMLFLYTWLAVMAKRLHDRDKSAAWLVLVFGGLIVLPAINNYLLLNPVAGAEHTPIIGNAALLSSLAINLWTFVELYCLRGSVGDNRFGLDPRH
jgi:uncharacterized membrane protein YhaH (DUF805 family)